MATVTDIDGNVYETVQIGEQLWMAENLKVTHYNNGDAITNVVNTPGWGDVFGGTYGFYGNDETYLEPYGVWYNAYAAIDNRDICPLGWHLPRIDEWVSLREYLGGSDWGLAGEKMKDNILWNGSNESGFTALPAGMVGGGFGTDGEWLGVGAYFHIYQEDVFVLTFVDLISEMQISEAWGGNQVAFSIRCLEGTLGCTDPDAYNYDEEANIDDGSCYGEESCWELYDEGYNQGQLEGYASGLEEGILIGSESGDVNGDGTLNILDLVIFVDLILNP